VIDDVAIDPRVLLEEPFDGLAPCAVERVIADRNGGKARLERALDHLRVMIVHGLGGRLDGGAD
jgi:hypothetical protein